METKKKSRKLYLLVKMAENIVYTYNMIVVNSGSLLHTNEPILQFELPTKLDWLYTGPEVIKLFSCSILKAHSIKISRNSAFSGLDEWGMLFFLFINVKMPTIVGVLTFMGRKNFMLNSIEHGKKFYNLRARAIVFKCLG